MELKLITIIRCYVDLKIMAEITEILLSSIATTITATSAALIGIGLLYSITSTFVTATVSGSLSKTIHTKTRNKIIKFSQM